jgi:hypothetical protein
MSFIPQPIHLKVENYISLKKGGVKRQPNNDRLNIDDIYLYGI